MFVWLLHFKGFFLYALLFYIKNVGCGLLFTSVHPNIYYRTLNYDMRGGYPSTVPSPLFILPLCIPWQPREHYPISAMVMLYVNYFGN